MVMSFGSFSRDKSPLFRFCRCSPASTRKNSMMPDLSRGPAICLFDKPELYFLITRGHVFRGWRIPAKHSKLGLSLHRGMIFADLESVDGFVQTFCKICKVIDGGNRVLNAES